MSWSKFFQDYIDFRGINAQGEHCHQRHVGSSASLRDYLAAQKITLLSYKRGYRIHLYRSTKQRYLTMQLLTELAELLQAQFNLIEALILLDKKQTQPQLVHSLKQLIIHLQDGQKFSDSLQRSAFALSPMEHQLIRIAETTHQLPDILQQITAQYHFYLQLKQNFIKALIYPCAVVCFTLLIVSGLILFVIPQFQTLFNNLNATLPKATQWLITLSQQLTQHAYLFSISCIMSLIGMGLLARRFVGYLPLIGKLYRMQQIAQWSRATAMSLAAGLPLLAALDGAQHILTYRPFIRAANELCTAITTGNTLHQALSEIRFLDPHQCALIEIGELSATLAPMLLRISTQASHTIEQWLVHLSKWLEPVMMLILAILTGALMITLYLPIFQLGTLL